MLIEKFSDPPCENRPRPFWFFNGDMDKDEIRRQILMFKEQGLGGFFICARQGLKVPYLGEEWHKTCAYAVQTAKECGLEVWLYDEYPYPSGMSGGEVTIRHPEAKQKELMMRVINLNEGEELNESLGESRLVSALAWQLTGGEDKICWDKPLNIEGFSGLLQNQQIYQRTEGNVAYRHNLKRYFSYGPSRELRWKPVKGKWRVFIAFSKDIDDFKYYGNFLDPCSKDAVLCFLNTTYETAKKNLGGEFSKTVKGMFADETGFLGRFPWSLHLPDYFEKRFGYSLACNLAALADNSYPEAIRVRYHYYQCIHELLKENYHRPVSKWCEENGIRYVTEVPSMRMSNQMYTHVPGGDCCHDKLGFPFDKVIERDFRSIRGNPKMASAIARQFNRRDSLIEAFHSLGWTAALQDMKWQIDRLTLSGVSFHNFHAFYYTVDGITKHDAPPSQSVQNPYWKYYKIFADYCARSSRYITETEASIKTALFHPAIDLCTHHRTQFNHLNYCGFDKEEEKNGQRLINDYTFICKTLFSCQIDYDDLDAEVMAMGKIENGVIKIGRAEYTCLIVPPVTFIEKYALELIIKFFKSGGKLIFTGLTPFLSGEKDFDPVSVFNKTPFMPLCKEDYFASQNKKNAECKSYKILDNLAFFSAPGGLKESKAEKELSNLLRDFIQVKTEAFLVNQQNENDSFLHEQLFKKGIISQRREKGNDRFIMLASLNGEEAKTKALFKDCPCGASFYELDLENGSIFPVNAEKNEEGFFIDAPLSPWRARIFAMTNNPETLAKLSGAKLPAAPAIKIPDAKILCLKLNLDDKVPVKITGDNVFRLEEMRVSLNGGGSFKSKPNIFIEHLKESGNICARQIKFSGGFGIPKRLSVNYPQDAVYHFEFTIKDYKIPDNIRLLRDKMGIMGDFKFKINNIELSDSSWTPSRLYDQNNLAANINAFLKEGRNSLDVFVTINEDWHGLSDPMYILGDFGVFKNEGVSENSIDNFYISKAPKAVVPNAKAVVGYPFFSGRYIYEIEINIENIYSYDSFTIELPEKYHIYECVEISVNDYNLGPRVFSPYMWHGSLADSAGILKQGSNLIKLSITNTLSNMFEGSYFDYEKHTTITI